MSDLYKAFLSALENYPSQDNEGYHPDRAGFKCGFYSGYRYAEEKIKLLESELAKEREISDWLDFSFDHDPSCPSSDRQHEFNEEYANQNCSCMDRNAYNLKEVIKRARQRIKERDNE